MAMDGTASNNTVNLLASMTLSGVNGGTGSGSGDTGNTINFAAKDITITDNIYAVQNLNFYLPQGIAANDTMVTVNGGATNSCILRLHSGGECCSHRNCG